MDLVTAGGSYAPINPPIQNRGGRGYIVGISGAEVSGFAKVQPIEFSSELVEDQKKKVAASDYEKGAWHYLREILTSMHPPLNL